MASAFPAFTRTIASDLSHSAVARKSAGGRSRLGRMIDAITEPRNAQAERAFAGLIERSGGRLTDSLEREAERRAAGLR